MERKQSNVHVAIYDTVLLENELIPEAITDLYVACGQPVVVTRAAEDGEQGDLPWVAYPAELAQAQLRDQSSV